METFNIIVVDPNLIIRSLLLSGEIFHMVDSLKMCAASLSKKKKIKILAAVLNMLDKFSYSADVLLRTKLSTVPGLLYYIALLCDGQDSFLINSSLFVNISIQLTCKSQEIAKTMVEAKWVPIILGSLSSGDKINIDWAAYAIFQLSRNFSVCKNAFIAVGAELVLEETLKKQNRTNDLNGWLSLYCKKSLLELRRRRSIPRRICVKAIDK